MGVELQTALIILCLVGASASAYIYGVAQTTIQARKAASEEIGNILQSPGSYEDAKKIYNNSKYVLHK